MTIYFHIFAATSSQEDLHRRIGGRCSTDHMKIVFKVCCAPEETAANTTARTSTSPTSTMNWSTHPTQSSTTTQHTTRAVLPDAIPTRKPTKKIGKKIDLGKSSKTLQKYPAGKISSKGKIYWKNCRRKKSLKTPKKELNLYKPQRGKILWKNQKRKFFKKKIPRKENSSIRKIAKKENPWKGRNLQKASCKKKNS